MNGSDFIDLAIRLSASKKQADLRTAVSRAYYGAFHAARTLVGDCGVSIPLDSAHKKVQLCLLHSHNTAVALAATKLGSLRDERNDADYDLEATKFNPSFVLLQLKAAQEIADALRACETEPTHSEIRSHVRAYARDVLKLIVAHS